MGNCCRHESGDDEWNQSARPKKPAMEKESLLSDNRAISSSSPPFREELKIKITKRQLEELMKRVDMQGLDCGTSFMPASQRRRLRSFRCSMSPAMEAPSTHDVKVCFLSPIQAVRFALNRLDEHLLIDNMGIKRGIILVCTAADQGAPGQDLNSSQYWENLYPGWKYDPSTGQWSQVDGFDAGASLQENVDSNSTSMPEGKANISYLQQTAQTVVATVGATSTTESVTDWNQASQVNDATESTTNWNQVSQVSSDTTGVALNQDSQVNGGYPLHMVFDPQYPGWYIIWTKNQNGVHDISYQLTCSIICNITRNE
ncbi:Protein transport protein sec16 [Forsythia ovata]|uniref:Protein transport protein sec16 n=1 Tax=Forsythia ovata TaxID=205694 RepID=A0ABD1S4I4_9LAMI